MRTIGLTLPAVKTPDHGEKVQPQDVKPKTPKAKKTPEKADKD